MEYPSTARRRRRFLLPDGSERYLVDEALLFQATTIGDKWSIPSDDRRSK